MMNSTLKPVLPTTQTTAPTPNKPMHPQGAPVSYGQPSGPIPQNPYPNTNVAHNSASQQNHFSLSGGSPFNVGTIPASNHPVAISQPSSGQVYNQPKNVSYSSGFQNAQNQNTLPPVSQALPATTSPTPAPTPAQNTSTTQNVSTTQNTESSEETEKLQPNGTTQDDQAPEVDTPNIQENHVTPQLASTEETKQDTTSPSPSQEKTPEEPSPEPLNSTNEVDNEVSKESDKEQNSLEPAPVPEPSPSPVPASASTTPVVSVPINADVPETSSAPVSEPVESSTQKEEETETVQNDSVSTDVEILKETPDTDPLAIETTATSDVKLAHDQDKSVPLTETESKDEGSEDDEQSSDDVSDSEKCEKDEDPVKKSPAKKTKPLPQEQKTVNKSPVSKTPSMSGHTKRQRIMTQHYQSPLPEIEIITKISSSSPRTKNNDDKLIYFYKNEFLAVRNTEGGFYLCQAVQNIYKSSSKIKIRWLSQDKSDKSGEIYTPDFYDLTDFDCILTSLDLTRVGKGRYKLKPKEKERTDSILKRCLAVEKGEISQPSVSEEHPDGLDLSLYKDEEQLVKNKNRGTKRKSQPRTESPKKHVPIRKSPETPKVRKVETKPTKSSTPSKKVTPAKKPAAPEPKKTPARGKRKSDTKTSPVVDPKKAKVLARIGRKTAIPASNSKPQAKSAKLSKPTPSTSKVTKPTPGSSKTPPRKAAKRSSRK